MVQFNELIKNINILLADDDEDYMSMTYTFLTQLGYKVDKASDGNVALKMLKSNKYQIALLDYFMPGLTGEQVVEEIRKENQEIIIILQTGFSGQNPPVDTLKKLGIQNYYDKTEGIDRLHLELISAVKIFNQQNEIELTKFKTNAIGNLIAGVAQEIKSTLLSVGAGLEYTNLLVKDKSNNLSSENAENINKFYINNKESLERVDRALSSIINQSSNEKNSVISDKEVMDTLNLILSSDLKTSGVKLNQKVALKTHSYITGGINDAMFIIADLIKRLLTVQESGTEIELVLSEDEVAWYFSLSSDKVFDVIRPEMYFLNRVVKSLENTSLQLFENKLLISISK